MSQARVVPLTVAARAQISTDGRIRSLGAVPVTLSGQALLYNPTTRVTGPVVQMRAQRSTSGWITFDPRSLANNAFPWVYAIGLTATASAIHGVGRNRRTASTSVSISGFIGYID